MKYDLIIGIDPGVRTGCAVWDKREKRFLEITTQSIIGVMDDILEYHRKGYKIQIRFEDARLRKWFGDADREKLQGAGSIKRDSSIWAEFCDYHEIDCVAIPPAAQKGLTKMSAEQFQKMTGWTDRTSEHARDAAMIVYGL